MPDSHKIADFYRSGKEKERLSRGIGPLEHLRTREILTRFLPDPPASICDIGGAHGVYAFWLAALGYDTHLLDLSPELIEEAWYTARQEGTPELGSIQVGDARHLPYPDRSMDAALLQGPLYHLQDRADRMLALNEAWRVLKPGGTLLAFGITHTASLMVGLHRGWIWDEGYHQMVHTEVTTGLHTRPETWPNLFMDAFFHAPVLLQSEVQAAGFEAQETLGLEGPAWMVEHFEDHWTDPEHQKRILDIARLVERDPVLSPHFVCIAQRPG